MLTLIYAINPRLASPLTSLPASFRSFKTRSHLSSSASHSSGPGTLSGMGTLNEGWGAEMGGGTVNEQERMKTGIPRWVAVTCLSRQGGRRSDRDRQLVDMLGVHR